MLRSTLTESPFMQVTILQPVSEDTDTVRTAFERYTFPDGRTGRWWIEDRVKALLSEEGEYWKPMRRDRQLDYVVSTLEGMRKGTVPRWNANRLIISLFDAKKDLHVSRAPTPPCLINVGFYPVKRSLTLIANFRAQYTDAKAYGNLLSLAMLLRKISEETGFMPLKLYSVAQKAILKYPKSVGKDLLTKLLASI